MKRSPVRFRQAAPEPSIKQSEVLLKPASLIGRVGFLLPQRIAAGSMTYQHFLGSYVGTSKIPGTIYEHRQIYGTYQYLHPTGQT